MIKRKSLLILVFLVNVFLSLACGESLFLTDETDVLSMGEQMDDYETPQQFIIGSYACISQYSEITEAKLIRVIDGDSIEVEIDGREYQVRYIGMNTPEWDEPFGSQATERNASLFQDETIWLVKDVSQTDKYDRLLRFVFNSNGEFVNKILVEEGLAEQRSYRPDTACDEFFQAAQDRARINNQGIWGSGN